jgi:hypothetical protein
MNSNQTENAAPVLEPGRVDKFKQGIRETSESAEELLAGLRRQGAAHALLGSQLAGLLKNLRQQRTYSMDLAMGVTVSSQFDAYIKALGNLRATVAQWLTVHAVNPYSIEVEATDFEMQCLRTLGAGLTWLESLGTGGTRDSFISDTEVMTSVFGMESAHGEDITDQVQHDWNEYNEPAEATA